MKSFNIWPAADRDKIEPTIVFCATTDSCQISSVLLTFVEMAAEKNLFWGHRAQPCQNNVYENCTQVIIRQEQCHLHVSHSIAVYTFHRYHFFAVKNFPIGCALDSRKSPMFSSGSTHVRDLLNFSRQQSPIPTGSPLRLWRSVVQNLSYGVF